MTGLLRHGLDIATVFAQRWITIRLEQQVFRSQSLVVVPRAEGRLGMVILSDANALISQVVICILSIRCLVFGL